jgi:hypothetical protein
MVVSAVNATGWNELLDANLVGAVFTMFDTAFGAGWVILILFITYQLMLWLKTRNIMLMFMTGVFFAGLYYTSTLVKGIGWPIIILIIGLELGIIIYTWVWK